MRDSAPLGRSEVRAQRMPEAVNLGDFGLDIPGAGGKNGARGNCNWSRFRSRRVYSSEAGAPAPNGVEV